MTQVELGRLLGLSGGAISQMESGITDIPLSTIDKLVKTFSCDPCQLFPDLCRHNLIHSEEETEVIALWQGLPKPKREALLSLLRVLKNDLDAA